MTTALYLRPPSAGHQQAEWLELHPDGNLLASGSLQWPDDLAQLRAQAEGKSLTVLLPVDQALVTRVLVPQKQRKHLAQVLPYLLEEQLAGTVDDLHVVAGVTLDGDNQQVIAIEHQHLQRLRQQLAEHLLVADEIVIDALCLPAVSDRATLLVLGDEALLRVPDGTAQLLNRNELDSLLPLLCGERTVHAFRANAELELPAVCSEVEDIDLPLALLARQVLKGTGIVSLLQGPYARRTAWHSHWQAWRRVALIAGVALLLQYAYAVTDWLLLKQRSSALDSAIRSSFAQAFPDQASTPYPTVSMNGYVKNLGSGGASGFTALLDEVRPVLKASDGISLRGLGYEAASNELRLDLSARDLSALNQLDSSLQQRGFTTDLGQASAGSAGYSGRLVLRRAAAGVAP